ncbi:Protein YIPF1, partial [Clarias magur]
GALAQALQPGADRGTLKQSQGYVGGNDDDRKTVVELSVRARNEDQSGGIFRR